MIISQYENMKKMKEKHEQMLATMSVIVHRKSSEK